MADQGTGSNTVTEFRVRWKGYGPDDDTWEPRQALQSVKGKLAELEKKQGAKSA